MIDRVRLAFKVLFVRKIVVITKSEQFSTMDNCSSFQSSNGGKVIWGDFYEN